MRITIALSLLATLCTIEALPSTDLEILRIQVRNMKWDVETVIRQLELLRIQAEEDTLREVSLKWNQEQDSYRMFENSLLSGIHSDLDAAKAEGKNVDKCYDNLKGIEVNEKVAFDDASKCEDVARDSIHNNLGFIDNLISTAQSLSMELDNVFLNCHDSDIYRMQTCIIGELARIEGELKELEKDSITAEITIRPVSKNVVMQAGNCIKQAYSVTYSGGLAIKMGVKQCIETATTEKPTEEPTEKPIEKSKEPKEPKESEKLL